MMKPLETQPRTFQLHAKTKTKVQTHFSPLNCTFLHCISKKERCKPVCNKFFNEINDLESTLNKVQSENRSKLST